MTVMIKPVWLTPAEIRFLLDAFDEKVERIEGLPDLEGTGAHKLRCELVRAIPRPAIFAVSARDGK